MKRLLQLASLPLLLAFLPFSGCSTQHYRKSADKEAYRAIAQKEPRVKNMDEHFSIDQTNEVTLEGVPVATNLEAFLGPEGVAEVRVQIIPLEKALEIAITHNRDYQLRKEQLYLTALGLTL